MDAKNQPKDGSIRLTKGPESGTIFIDERAQHLWKGIGSSSVWNRSRRTSIKTTRSVSPDSQLTPDFSVSRVFDKHQGHTLLRKYFPTLAGRDVYIQTPLDGYVLQGVV